MGSGAKGGGNFSGSKSAQPGQSTPNLFQPYQQLMPSSYGGSGPINDPTSILNAYMQNLPAFLNASRSAPIQQPPTAQTPPVAPPDSKPTKLVNPRPSLYPLLQQYQNPKGGY